MTIYPDPSLTASLFAEGHLDALLGQVIAPALANLEPEDGAYWWLMRYGLHGDHWKIRLHGSAELADRFKAALEESATRGFAALPAENGGGKKISSRVPIDIEDEHSAEAATEKSARARGLYWTHYRRSAVCLGEPALHENDRYCAIFTRALGRSTAILLDRVEPGSGGVWSHGVRFNFLLKALADAVAELRFSSELESSYLTYHRDWLLRFSAGARPEAEAHQDACRLFDRRIEKMADGGQRLVDFVCGRLKAVRADSAQGLWRGELAAAISELEPIAEQVRKHIDSYAERPVFSPLFKILQGMANQCGLNLIEEAYVHHLLLHAMSVRETST